MQKRDFFFSYFPHLQNSGREGKNVYLHLCQERKTHDRRRKPRSVIHFATKEKVLPPFLNVLCCSKEEEWSVSFPACQLLVVIIRVREKNIPLLDVFLLCHPPTVPVKKKRPTIRQQQLPEINVIPNLSRACVFLS